MGFSCRGGIAAGARYRALFRANPYALRRETSVRGETQLQGLADGDELLAGTNPANPNSHPGQLLMRESR